MNNKIIFIICLIYINFGVTFYSHAENTNTDSLAKSVYELGMAYYSLGDLEQTDIILRYILLDFLANPSTSWHNKAELVLLSDRMYQYYVNTDYWLKYTNEINRMDDIKLFDLESIARKYRSSFGSNDLALLYSCVGGTNFIVNVSSNKAAEIGLNDRAVIKFNLVDRNPPSRFQKYIFNSHICRFEAREITPVRKGEKALGFPLLPVKHTNVDSLAKSVYEIGMKYYEQDDLEQADIILRYILLDFLANPNTSWHDKAELMLLSDRMYQYYADTDYWLRYKYQANCIADNKLFDLESVVRKYRSFCGSNDLASLYSHVGKTNFIINVSSNKAVEIEINGRRVTGVNKTGSSTLAGCQGKSVMKDATGGVWCPYEKGNPAQPIMAILSFPPLNKPSLIVWDDGRIIWSRAKLAVSPCLNIDICGGPPFYEYKYDKAKVRNLLKEFDNQGFFNELSCNVEIPEFCPNLDYFVLFVRNGKQILNLKMPAYLHQETIEDFTGDNLKEIVPEKAFGIQMIVLSRISKLIPSEGKPIDFKYEMKK